MRTNEQPPIERQAIPNYAFSDKNPLYERHTVNFLSSRLSASERRRDDGHCDNRSIFVSLLPRNATRAQIFAYLDVCRSRAVS
jgi:hypothetical protein